MTTWVMSSPAFGTQNENTARLHPACSAAAGCAHQIIHVSCCTVLELLRAKAINYIIRSKSACYFSFVVSVYVTKRTPRPRRISRHRYPGHGTLTEPEPTRFNG